MYKNISKKIIFDFFEIENDFDGQFLIYKLECYLVNLTKFFYVYGAALLFDCLFETFTMHVTFVILRFFAHGWHAKQNVVCTLFSFIFVIVPLLFKNLLISTFPYGALMMMNWLFFFFFAPAASEEKRNCADIEQKVKRNKILVLVTVIGCFAGWFEEYRSMVVCGLTVTSFLLVVNQIILKKEFFYGENRVEKKIKSDS